MDKYSEDRQDRQPPPQWWVALDIPDERATSSRQQIKIKTVRKKNFPLFGKVVDVIWKGVDADTGLMNTLSKDLPTKTLTTRIGNLEIKREEGFQG